jgi:hypothetical protein
MVQDGTPVSKVADTGWRKIKVMEQSLHRKTGAGPWIDLCPACSEKFDWLMPKEFVPPPSLAIAPIAPDLPKLP